MSIRSIEIQDFSFRDVIPANISVDNDIKEVSIIDLFMNLEGKLRTPPPPRKKTCFGFPLTDIVPSYVTFPNMETTRLLENTNLYNYVLRIPYYVLQMRDLPEYETDKRLELVIGKFDMDKYYAFLDSDKGKTDPDKFETNQGIKHGQLLNYNVDLKEKPPKYNKLVFSGTLIQIFDGIQYTLLINPMSGCWKDLKDRYDIGISYDNMDKFNTLCMTYVLKRSFGSGDLIISPCDSYEGDKSKCQEDIPKLIQPFVKKQFDAPQ